MSHLDYDVYITNLQTKQEKYKANLCINKLIKSKFIQYVILSMVGIILIVNGDGNDTEIQTQNFEIGEDIIFSVAFCGLLVFLHIFNLLARVGTCAWCECWCCSFIIGETRIVLFGIPLSIVGYIEKSRILGITIVAGIGFELFLECCYSFDFCAHFVCYDDSTKADLPIAKVFRRNTVETGIYGAINSIYNIGYTESEENSKKQTKYSIIEKIHLNINIGMFLDGYIIGKRKIFNLNQFIMVVKPEEILFYAKSLQLNDKDIKLILDTTSLLFDEAINNPNKCANCISKALDFTRDTKTQAICRDPFADRDVKILIEKNEKDLLLNDSMAIKPNIQKQLGDTVKNENENEENENEQHLFSINNSSQQIVKIVRNVDVFPE